MEEDDETIVIIVGDEMNSHSDKSSNTPFLKLIKEISKKRNGTLTTLDSPEDTIQEDILELDETVEYLNDSELDEEIDTENKDTSLPSGGKRIKKKRWPGWQMRSFVKELQERYPELAKDRDLLIGSLVKIMKSIKPPPPPQGWYVMNGTIFECVVCSHLDDNLAGLGRHYQDRHGPRYLLCLTCSKRFSRDSSLYKHEKICRGFGTEEVLRARALVVANKGRDRPFLNKIRPGTRRRGDAQSESRAGRCHGRKLAAWK